MELRIRSNDSLRIVGDHKGTNFIDIYGVGYDSLAVDFFSHFQYIEIRKKKDILRVFAFPKKSLKKECDFGWWDDAEIVFAQNEQKYNK